MYGVSLGQYAAALNVDADKIIVGTRTCYLFIDGEERGINHC